MVLQITVLDGNNQPVSGATVEVQSGVSGTYTTNSSGFASHDTGITNGTARILVRKTGYKSRSLHYQAPVGGSTGTYQITTTIPVETSANTGLYFTSLSVENLRPGKRFWFAYGGFSIENYRPNEPKRVTFRGFSLERYRGIKIVKLLTEWH